MLLATEEALSRGEGIGYVVVVTAICGVVTLLINRRYDAKYVKLESDVKECAEDREQIKTQHNADIGEIKSLLEKCQRGHEESQTRFEDERRRNEERITKLLESMIINRAADNAGIQAQLDKKQ